MPFEDLDELIPEPTDRPLLLRPKKAALELGRRDHRCLVLVECEAIAVLKVGGQEREMLIRLGMRLGKDSDVIIEPYETSTPCKQCFISTREQALG